MTKSLLSALMIALLPLAAEAGVAEKLKQAEELRSAAEKDLEYLINNVHKCTRYHGRLNDEKFKPMQATLKGYQSKLVAGYAKLMLEQITGDSCKLPNKTEFTSAADTTAKIHNEIEAALKEIASNDRLLLKAFAAVIVLAITLRVLGLG